MRLPARLLAMSILFAAPVLLADAPASAPATQPLVAPAISGKLGTPVELLEGIKPRLIGWAWYQFPASKKYPTPIKMEEVWTVKDGILHSAGKPTGYLVYQTPFENFVLRVEERHIEKGNGGLLVGIKNIPEKGWPGLEIQTQTGNAGDLWNHNLLKMTGDAARTDQGGKHIKKLVESQKPVGEWDVMEVVVDHGKLTFSVNGVVQNVVTDTESLAGKVGLQAEGAAMEFRRVTVTPIE